MALAIQKKQETKTTRKQIEMNKGTQGLDIAVYCSLLGMNFGDTSDLSYLVGKLIDIALDKDKEFTKIKKRMKYEGKNLLNYVDPAKLIQDYLFDKKVEELFSEKTDKTITNMLRCKEMIEEDLIDDYISIMAHIHMSTEDEYALFINQVSDETNDTENEKTDEVTDTNANK
jgi:hypothetical protein